jgi:hypothetical protein
MTLLEEITEVIHNHSFGCTINLPIEKFRDCAACKVIAKQVAFVISQKFEQVFLGKEKA